MPMLPDFSRDLLWPSDLRFPVWDLLSWRLQYRTVCQDGVPIGFLEQEAYNKKNGNCPEPAGFVSEKVLNSYEKCFKIGNYE